MIIAEISANHLGDIYRAITLVKAAKIAGADAVKFQAYDADAMTIDHDGFVVKSGPWAGDRLYNLYKKAQTPFEWFPELFDIARELGLIPFASVFDRRGVDMLESVGCQIYKIASFEINHTPLIRYVASTKKPIIISTGVATNDDINEAIHAAEGSRSVVLMHCVSSYPTPIEQANLPRIQELIGMFGSPIGLSDHTLSTSVPAVAVAYGAQAIEKHLTLRRDEGGPDASFSLEPEEFKTMAAAWREAFQATIHCVPAAPMTEFRRSLYVVRDMEAGEVFTDYNVRSIRPGHGLHPRFIETVLGCRAKVPLKRGTPLSFEVVA